MRKQKFASFLRIQLEGQTQASLARAAGVTETAVSRWLAETTHPSFESCFRIAKYFNISPTHLFEMIRRSDYIDLYSWFLPDYKPKDISLEFVYQDADVRNIHETVDEIIAAANGEKPDIDVTSLVSSLLIRVSDIATKT